MAETPRDELPPHLAALSDEDLEGLKKRAAREGVPIEKLKLRENTSPDLSMTAPDQQTRKSVVGILGRIKLEKKPLKELPLRRTDDPLILADAMAEMCLRGGFPAKSSDGRPTGKLSYAEVDRAMAEAAEKKKNAGGK